jgi:hypothetical protein
MRELLRKGKVKEFVMDLINEVPSHGTIEAMLQTRLHAFTFICLLPEFHHHSPFAAASPSNLCCF